MSNRDADRDDAGPADLGGRVLRALRDAPVGIAIFDREMRYLAVSERFLQSFHLMGHGSLIGRCHYEVFPDIPERWREVHRRALAGQAASSEDDAFHRPDGRIDWVRWAVEPWREADGAIGGLVLRAETINSQVEERNALAAAERRYRGVFDQAAVGVARVSLDGRFLEVNERFCAIAGRDRDELLGLHFRDITHPEDLEADVAQVQAILVGAIDTYSMEKRYLTREGRIVWINLTVSVARTPSGEPEHFIAVIEDIGQRRAAQEALQASEARFRTLADLSPDAILINRNDRFVYANEAAVRLYGVADAGQLLGRSPYDFSGAHEHPSIRDRLERLRAGEAVETAELEIIRPDGVRIIAEVSSGPVEWGGGPAIQALVRDVSQRKADEAALRETEARAREQLEELEAIYETSPVGLAFLTPDLRFVRVNRRLAEMNGFPAAAHTGRTLRELIPSVADQADRILQRLLQGEPIVSSEFVGETPAAPGVIGHYLEYWLPLKAADGSFRGLNVVVEDITELKQAENRRKLLTDELNHRVRNTLAVVQSIARQTFAGEDVPQGPRVAFEQRLRALAAAHGILTREEWRSADLRELVDAAVGSQTRGRIDLDGPLVALRPGMAVAVSLALHELGTNASKYGALLTPEGRIDLRWTMEGRALRLIWREHGGPPVAKPARQGFGTRMLERALGAELHGAVRLDFRPQGLVCVLEAELPDDSAASEP